MSNLETYYHFELDFQKVNQHTGGKWLIHGTKCRKNNQLQNLITCNSWMKRLFIDVPNNTVRCRYNAV